MNCINSNINVSKNNRRIKPQKNKNNFNKSSKLRKNELKSKIYINYTDKNSKILYTNSNNVIYNSIDFPSTTTSTNRTNQQLYLPYKDSIKTSIVRNKSNSKNNNKKNNLGLSNSNKIISFNGITNKNLQNTSRKKTPNIELILNNKSDKKHNKKNFFNEKILEKNNKIDKLRKDLALSEMILNNLKNKNKKLITMENSNKHIVNKTYETNNCNSLKTENFPKNKKMLTLNINDNYWNKTKKGNSYTNIATLLTFNYINTNFPYKKNYYKSLSPQNKPIKNNFFPYKKNKEVLIRQNLPLTHTQKNLQREKIKHYFEDDFFEFKEKCEELKKRTKNILNKYIDLSQSLYNK